MNIVGCVRASTISERKTGVQRPQKPIHWLYILNPIILRMMMMPMRYASGLIMDTTHGYICFNCLFPFTLRMEDDDDDEGDDEEDYYTHEC